MSTITPVQRERMSDLVNALRSGEYKQGKGRLKRTVEDVTSHCCEGVATERAMEPLGIEERIYPSRWDITELRHDFDDHGTVMQPNVAAYYGFESVPGYDGQVIRFPEGLKVRDGHAEKDEPPFGVVWLPSANDSGMTFDQIADMIAWYYLSE